MARLPASFFNRDVVDVARALIGQRLEKDGIVLRITETEAYRWDESACHAHRGLTPRNAPMWQPGGRAYVYLCYGIHHLLNITSEKKGIAAAVLIRACEPLTGFELIRQRRNHLEGPALLNGPGKVGAALALDVSWSGHSLVQSGGLEVHRGSAPAQVLSGPRIGVDYARPEHRALNWRFAEAGSPWVSHLTRFLR